MPLILRPALTFGQDLTCDKFRSKSLNDVSLSALCIFIMQALSLPSSTVSVSAVVCSPRFKENILIFRFCTHRIRRQTCRLNSTFGYSIWKVICFGGGPCFYFIFVPVRFFVMEGGRGCEWVERLILASQCSAELFTVCLYAVRPDRVLSLDGCRITRLRPPSSHRLISHFACQMLHCFVRHVQLLRLRIQIRGCYNTRNAYEYIHMCYVCRHSAQR